MNRKTLFAFAAMLLLPAVMQATIPDLKFRRLDTRNGLSNSQVNCSFRDSKGFMWFGTAYGLNRYDGYRVKTFFANMRDTTTMRDNFTSEIMEAWDGKLWLHQGMNYSIFDPVTEQFERSASRELEKYFGFNSGVERVWIDSKKNYWVKFYDLGLYYYNPQTKKTAHYKLGYSHDEINPTYNLSTMADNGDEVLFITTNGEMISLHGEQGLKMGEDRWLREHGAPENTDYRLCVDPFHNIWVATESQNYVKLNRDKQWRIGLDGLLQEYGISNIPTTLQLWDVKVDGKGRIWCATDHEGLIVLDLPNHEMRQFLNSKLDESTISENTLRNIYLDNRGLIWIGTYKNGVNMIKEGSASMVNVDLGDINAVSEDRFGNYWLGTNERGIIVYNPKTQEQVAHYTKENSPMFGNIMVGTCVASDGSVWFGGYNSGLTRCIPKNTSGEAVIMNYHYDGSPNGLATDNVWSVTEDKWHRIWIGTLGGGIQMLDLKKGTFRTWNQNNTDLPSNYMTSATWIKKGWLMVGTSWYYCFVNPVTGKVANRVIPEDPSIPVQTGNTTCVIEDSRGIIWQGSSSGAIAFDQKRKSVRLLDMQDGLFGSSVSSIIEDKNHAIWVVTDHGVSKIIPELREDGIWHFNVSSYNNRDGLQQSVYNQRSTCLTHDGMVLIGGQGGLDIINPQALTGVKGQEHVIFSGLQIFDADVPVGKDFNGRVILDEALDVCREITLKFNDQFTIQLATDAGLINNGKRFVYKLDGFNENWVRTSELNPNITYNSLHAGSYTLRVRVLNDDGSFGEDEAELDITILPSFWRTRWMILLYMLLIAAVAWFWRKWFMKRQESKMSVESQRRELEKQQWMNEMRMKLMKGQEPKEKMEAPVQNVMELELHRQTEDLVAFTRSFCDHYQSPVPDKKTKLSFLSTVPELDVDFDGKRFEDIFQILFRNAINFTPYDSQISVGVARTSDGKAQIQVADNGIGIKDQFKEHAFDPIVNAASHTTQGVENGEGIGLDYVKQIIDGHEGTIHIEDNPGGGTIFVITLPVHEEIIEVVEAEEI